MCIRDSSRDEPTIFQRSLTCGDALPVNGVEPLKILIPLEPAENPTSVNVTELNVVLSLVTLALISEFISSPNSAKITIRAVLGAVFAVNVSDINVILELETCCCDADTITIPEPPAPPVPGGPPPVPPLPVFAVASAPAPLTPSGPLLPPVA